MDERGRHTILTEAQEEKLRDAYRKEPLFRALSAMLNHQRLKKSICISDTAVWHLTMRIYDELNRYDSYQSLEISRIHCELRERFEAQYPNDEPLARRTVTAVLFVLLVQLAKADPTNADPSIRALQRAVAIELTHTDRETYRYTIELRRQLEQCRTDNIGQPVSVEPKSYLTQRPTDEAQRMVERILQLTEPLRDTLRIDWANYVTLWQRICADRELLQKLTQVSPRNNHWGLNMKLVLNVVGMLKATARSNPNDASTRTLADILGVSNKRRHIDSPKPKSGSSQSALTPPLYERIMTMISAICATH